MGRSFFSLPTFGSSKGLTLLPNEIGEEVAGVKMETAWLSLGEGCVGGGRGRALTPLLRTRLSPENEYTHQRSFFLRRSFERSRGGEGDLVGKGM